MATDSFGNAGQDEIRPTQIHGNLETSQYKTVVNISFILLRNR